MVKGKIQTAESLCILLLFIAVVVATMTSPFTPPATPVFMDRNFFGVLRIEDTPVQNSAEVLRTLRLGTVLQSGQVIGRPAVGSLVPGRPIVDLFYAYNFKKTLVIGLGAGEMNCYATDENDISFVEINSAVVRAAHDFFTYMKDCGKKKNTRIIQDDGRMALTRLNETFDFIIEDTYQSGGVPLHFLTREAMQLYLARLEPQGFVLFHIENKFMKLEEAICTTAASLALVCKALVDPRLPQSGTGDWIVITRLDTPLHPLENFVWTDVPLPGNLRPWTDDHTVLTDILEF